MLIDTYMYKGPGGCIDSRPPSPYIGPQVCGRHDNLKKLGGDRDTNDRPITRNHDQIATGLCVLYHIMARKETSMTEKPETKPIDAGYLPDKLCDTGRFCNWDYEYDKNRDAWTKVPYNPKTGQRADSTNPDTFTDLDTALEAEHNHDGVGVGVFGNLAAIDIDHCVNDDGEPSEMAWDIIRTMDTYTEKSPSRTGVRILCTVPDGFDYDAELEFYKKNPHNHVEIYVAGKTKRFVTLTGDAITPGFPLEERGDQLLAVLDKYMRRPTTDAKTHDTSIQPSGYTDEEIYNNMVCQEKYAKLWNGDWSEYESQSEADLAMCICLARWTGRDPERIDNLFRLSGLYRDKWERHDYHDGTINKATQSCEYTYVKGEQPKPDAQPSFTAYPVGEYIRGGQFGQDIGYFGQFKDRKIGFDNLDKYLTLYPGVCAFGGSSSIGKTTFLINASDNLVQRGEWVLFFSLEQLPIELVSKSLARRLYALDPFSKITNVDIKNGATSPDLEHVKREYAATADQFVIVRCNFTTTAREICDYIEAFIQEHNVKPVCIIDYLQLISPPPEFKGDQRAAIDHNIKLFKTMQLKHELFVVLVSSFNRAGYDSPATFSDFKESGLLEYSADYVLALQLEVVTEHDFNFRPGAGNRERQATAQEKQEMIDAALADPDGVRVQVVARKNRNGKQNFACNFRYIRQFDVFQVDDKPQADNETPTDNIPAPEYDQINLDDWN